MKKNLINYIVLACTALIFTSCNMSNNKTLENTKGDPVIQEVVKGCTGDHGQIKRDAAVLMVNDYNLINETITNAKLPYVNAQKEPINLSLSTEVHFSLENMKCFIEYVESMGEDYDNLGIRAYLAAQDSGDGNYETTILFAPTGNSKKGEMNQRSSSSLNIPGANLLNHGHAGRPPTSAVLTNP